MTPAPGGGQFPPIEVNPHLLRPGAAAHRPQTEQLLDKYRLEVEAELRQYGVQTELELEIGKPVRRSPFAPGAARAFAVADRAPSPPSRKTPRRAATNSGRRCRGSGQGTCASTRPTPGSGRATPGSPWRRSGRTWRAPGTRWRTSGRTRRCSPSRGSRSTPSPACRARGEARRHARRHAGSKRAHAGQPAQKLTDNL